MTRYDHHAEELYWFNRDNQERCDMAEKRRLTDAQINDLADTLRGSAMCISEPLREHGLEFEDLTIGDCAALDALVLECDSCNWWVESDLVDDDGRCDECSGHD